MIWALLAILAHDPITTKITWDLEISRLVNQRCLACHNAGSAVDLSGYETARPWAKAIRNQVMERRMPPWGAVKGYGEFKNDPTLTPLEVEMIVQWVEGGAPEGKPEHLPHFVKTPVTEALKLRWTTVPALIQKPVTLTAIRATGPVEVAAQLPDGTVEPLLWVRDPQASWKQAYVFREPVKLPGGSRLQVTGAPVWLSTGKSDR